MSHILWLLQIVIFDQQSHDLILKAGSEEMQDYPATRILLDGVFASESRVVLKSWYVIPFGMQGMAVFIQGWKSDFFCVAPMSLGVSCEQYHQRLMMVWLADDSPAMAVQNNPARPTRQ